MSSTSFIAPVHGGSETVICLHCSGGSGRQWRSLATHLGSRFVVRMPDLLGYSHPGGWASGARVSLDDEAERLSALLSDANAPVHLVGHSYGGAVALQIALRWPARVASLTLYEPVRFALLSEAGIAGAVEAAQAAEARYQITTVGNRFALAVISGRLQEAAQLFADYWGGPGTWDSLDLRRRQLQASLTHKVNADFQAIFSDPVPASDYERLEMPVHLIGGTSSPLPARVVMRRLAARLPRVSTVSVVGLGHLGPINAAERVQSYLPAWLQPAAPLPGTGRAAELLAA